jgi:hypothetical protein
MANNPLQQYFRQPKLYIELPTRGVYCDPDIISKSKITVFGMTGMDELILKTPDALLSGDCISKVIKSCCPEILEPTKLSSVDIDCILVAIRIATYGAELSAGHTCEKCQAENEYAVDLNRFMEHYKSCKYDSSIKLENMTLFLKPVTFETANSISLENFVLQKKLLQVNQLTDEIEQEQQIRKIFDNLGAIQQKLINLSIEQIELSDQMVTEREYIEEFLANCEKDIFDKIKEQFDINNKQWKLPSIEILCESCQHADELTIELNQTNFFGGA